MILAEYTVDKDGWWYKWNYRWHKYVALKKEHWPTENKESNKYYNQKGCHARR
jgi:hypothetical protein